MLVGFLRPSPQAVSRNFASRSHGFLAACVRALFTSSSAVRASLVSFRVAVWFLRGHRFWHLRSRSRHLFSRPRA